MGTVTLGGVTITQTDIIDFNRINRSIVSVPDYINVDTELDTNVWVRKLTILEYVVRMTDSSKYYWEQKMNEHTTRFLVDSIHDISGNVWINSVESEWTGNENDSNPWKVTLELIGMITDVPTLELEYYEPWNYGAPSFGDPLYFEEWNYPNPPTFTLLHSEEWSS